MDAEEDVADVKTDAARAKAAERLDHLKALQAARCILRTNRAAAVEQQEFEGERP